MLQIVVPATEYWDERQEMFITKKEQTLQLEHSLVSLSKWESKWHKPFLSKKDITYEETLDYIRCMTITPNVDPEVYFRLTNENIDQINRYIEEPMTATTFREDNSKPNREIVTAEIIYYWMITAGVPFECQKWHLNRLLTLIRVCNIKNGPAKKMSKKEILQQNAALNASRRARLHSRG